jgi:hypothetical protein
MQFSEAMRVWRRRRALTVALLISVLAVLAALAAVLPRTYQSQSSVVLLASRAAAKLNGGNPYLSFTPSLTLTADAVSRELMAPVIAQRLAASGFTASYTVTLPADTTATTGSVLLIVVTGGSKTAVQSTLQAVTSEVNLALARIQGNVRPADQIRTATLSFAPEATLNTSKTARPLAAVAGLGLLIAFGFPLMVDGRVSRRRLRQAEEPRGRASAPAGSSGGSEGWGVAGAAGSAGGGMGWEAAGSAGGWPGEC